MLVNSRPDATGGSGRKFAQMAPAERNDGTVGKALAVLDQIASYGRPVRFGEERIREAAKQGFATAIVPAGNVPRKAVSGIDVIGVRKLDDALTAALG